MAKKQTIDAQRHTRAERLRSVAAARLGGYDQATIARQLGVHQSTISRDIAALDQLYLEEAQRDTAAFKGLHRQRLERLLAAVWKNATDGDIDAHGAALATLKREADLLGLDAPKRRYIEGDLSATVLIRSYEGVPADFV